MDDSPSERQREDELPEHEMRPPAEESGPTDDEVLVARDEELADDEPAMDPDRPPPAYRPPTG
jgi:hypothetical protein